MNGQVRTGGGTGPGGAPRRAAACLDEPSLAAWAGELGRAAVRHGAFVCLHGPLGAGKSTVVRAACRGAGVKGVVPSPTFTLVTRHRTPDGTEIQHADLYRIESPALLTEAGWPELLESAGAVFVEWAERAGPHLPAERWEVHLSFAAEPDRRRVEVRRAGGAPPLPAPGGGSC
ncbi:MAG: tRNA (adenosine(37)-N6)-threonylcarbamoyltransferase complex ATPase subunit type 1 TsaE [Gemmatimonadota bacterium]|nr:tRNA (adenosine(37)-N6)-threonylcarbamoyltransferase complex ATPase subunit type 1 TsaE [Gemmatimonadota bacterium]